MSDTPESDPRGLPFTARPDHAPPPVVAQLGWRYHHVGIPTTVARPGETHLERYGLHLSGFSASPYGIEWMRFEKGTPVHELIRSVPHVAFEVDDLEAALQGREVIAPPDSPSSGVRSAMIVHNGAPVELIWFREREEARHPTAAPGGFPKIEPVTLRGGAVCLEPLTLDHAPALAAAGLDPELWRWIPTPVTTAEEMRDYVLTALDERRRAVSLPFAIVHLATGRVIGSTRFANIVPADRRLEIGWTWITPAFQRTAVNTETKLLLLAHAFETLHAIRVEFKTDRLNERSRQALLRIGAVEEGTFRKHRITASGRVRDTVYFSIVDTEWPAVRAKLAARRDGPPPATR